MIVQGQTHSAVPLLTSHDEDAPLRTRKSLSDLLVFFCWNVANPSLRRAQIQASWLQEQPADVLVLSECKNSKGCQFLETYLRNHGYHVVFPRPDGNEYGVLIASKYPIDAIDWLRSANPLRCRVVCVSLSHPSFPVNLEITGIYVPSRDQSYEKRERKRRFMHSLLGVLDERANRPYRICCGDFNVVEPNHIPRYGSIFRTWEYGFYTAMTDYDLRDVFRVLNPRACEYSWVGRTGDGYRYDHCFVSTDLLPIVQRCHYLHAPREARLSDHSALVMQLAIESS